MACSRSCAIPNGWKNCAGIPRLRHASWMNCCVEPPGQFRTRKTLAAIDIAGTVIPKDARLVLLFASGNRDPKRFAHPDRFDPDRTDNPHFGFGAGPHYCIGAPLARLEAEAALAALRGDLSIRAFWQTRRPIAPAHRCGGRSISCLGLAVLPLRFA